ncbi:MAG TPA: DNA mismatch repair endonuclease MutL, partial [Verrucomicrobiae bacterium]|nr:DNA mismatch repair endonuclease MutL [Verrucomicrobiae bacterium]
AEVKAAGAAPGTSIEVRQLFYNLPARRKFLRTEETEAAHIQHYLTLAALSFPDVAFTFQKDGRLVWQLPGVKSEPALSSRIAALRERLRALLGDERLVAVNFSTSLEDDFVPEQAEVFETASTDKSEPAPTRSAFHVWGLIGSPGVSRATRESQFVFVNRRPVENRGINYALIEGCHTTLMKGRFPVCCLFLEIDPAAVDVNVHPAKREVKFHREFEVRKFVAQAVRDALLSFHSQSEKKLAPQPQAPVAQQLPMDQPAAAAPAQVTEPIAPPLPDFPLPPAEMPSPAIQAPLAMGFSRATMVPPVSPGPVITKFPEPVPAVSPPAVATPLLNVPLRLVGVIGRLYVVLESDRGLVLLDQHAAHERILFEQMLNRLEQNEFAPTQKLLLPETIELSPRDSHFLREQLAPLTRLGVGLSEFGERTFLLDALPAFVKVADTRRFVLDLVDELKAAGREVNLARLGEHTVAKTVCRHAVKANDPLAGPELENLVADLRRCAMPYTCPHGRPTLIEMSYRELERKFGRAQ